MVILGIDPGIATVGFGVIAAANGRFGAIEYGAIITKPHQLLETRLCEIHDAVTELIRRHKLTAWRLRICSSTSTSKRPWTSATGAG